MAAEVAEKRAMAEAQRRLAELQAKRAEIQSKKATAKIQLAEAQATVAESVKKADAAQERAPELRKNLRLRSRMIAEVATNAAGGIQASETVVQLLGARVSPDLVACCTSP